MSRSNNPCTFKRHELTQDGSGNTLTDYFLQEVGITQFQFNVGQQLLSAGIVLLEVSSSPPQVPPSPMPMTDGTPQIPSNIVLYRVGPTVWLGGQIIAW